MPSAEPARSVRPLAFSVFAVSLLVLASGGAVLELLSPEVCPAIRETGRPCMGCGGTQAFVSVARGNVRAAWTLNPLGAFAGVALWLTAAVAMISGLTRRTKPLKWLLLGLVALTPAALISNGIVWLQKIH